ncbi:MULTISPECIES: SUKH-4 family immunity protein [Streptomyces]|uniref:SUKH-4 family immunity protein n=1 Tax=Streptomyces griseiscabiei TaxID=2993540 RepID=A0ABU4KUS5_9ACTN|nr:MULTISPECIES: SUKH-4 family immunity protein [Streptomyces]MBZ3902852.1 SUKH-4 family immunity protein [Streptomyces griseiscabiei]MDX2907162.1 SUKH-4 family immunity protein [Streptomyces griseiscabiei]
MSPHHSYAPEAVSPVRDATARRFLTEVGLPEEHLLFAATDPAVRSVPAGGSERKLLKIGQGGDHDEFCIDIESGEIVSLSTEDASIWHVNESVTAFHECLEEFSSRFPAGDEDTEPEEWEELSSRFEQALLHIDGTALREDPGFWYSLLHDVAIGDYAAD